MNNWIIGFLAALIALITWAMLTDVDAATSRQTVVHAIERMFNATPGMAMSQDIPGVGNRLVTYKRIEIRPGDEYAVILSVRQW